MDPLHEPYERRRFTADEVWRMVEAGVLRDDERVELIDGELVMVPPQGPEHADLTAELQMTLMAAYGPGFAARTHSPVVGTVDSIPEPDVAVYRGERREFRHRHPGPNDAVLIVEVASSTLLRDRRKANVYAKAGYATYWIVDVDKRAVEVRTAPRDGVYTKMEIVDVDGTLALPESTKHLSVASLFPST